MGHSRSDDTRQYTFDVRIFKNKMPSKVAKPKISKKAVSNAGSPSTSPKAVKPALTAHVESPGGDAATSVAPEVVKKGRGRPAGGAGRKKKKKDHKYRTHMGIVLRQVHPDIRISSQAVATMNSFLDDIFERIVGESAKLAHHPQRKTKRSRITVREIQTSCRLLLPGELAKHAISEGTKAVTKYFAEPK